MKKMLKILTVAALLLVAVMIFTACRGGNGNETPPTPTPAATATPAGQTPAPTPEPTPEPREVVTLRYSVQTPGREPQQHALDAMAAALYEHGFIIEFETFEQGVYGVLLAGLDTDLIMSARWEGFHDNARAGAFAPIDIEQIRTYMPVWYSENAGFLSSSIVDGQIFAIPNNTVGMNVPYLFLRRDWFPPGMDEVVTMQDLYDYLAHSLYLNPHIFPFYQFQGQVNWQSGAMGFAASHIMAPGTPRSVNAVVLDKRDYPNFVLRRTYETPELVEFFHWMRRFYEAGFTSSDFLNDPTPQQEAFIAGQSAVFNSANLDWLPWIHGEFTPVNPDVELALFDLGRENNVLVDFGSAMGRGISIPFRSADSIPDVLRLIELLYTHQDLHHLWRFGVYGEDWDDVDGRVRILDPEGRDMPIAYAPIYENHAHGRQRYGAWPEAHVFRQSVEARGFINPFVEWFFDMSDPVYGGIRTTLNDINLELLAPINLGLHADVDGAIENLLNRQIAAGLEAYEQEVLRQLNVFIEERGLNVTVRLP